MRVQGVGSGLSDSLHQGGDWPGGNGVHPGGAKERPNFQDLCQQSIS